MIGMLILLFVMFAALCYAGWRIEHLQAIVIEQGTMRHDGCVARIEALASDTFAASVLRYHADLWDSPLEQPVLARLGREEYKAGGPSMPTIWMRHHADLLDPKTEPLDGEKIR